MCESNIIEKMQKLSHSQQFFQSEQMNEGDQDILNKILELGFMNRQVNEYLNIQCETLSSQALQFAVKQESDKFKQFIIFLEQNDNLTLKNIYFYSYDQFQYLKQILIIINCIQNTPKYILSMIYQYINNGNQQLSQLVSRLFDITSKPFIKFVNEWMISGIINDQFEEFFITENKSSSQWDMQFNIDIQRVPMFLDYLICQKILTIGKSVDFIKKKCDVTDWQLDENIYNLNDIAQLKEQIDNIYLQTNKKLLEIINQNYNLVNQMEFIKQYVLFGKGDFFLTCVENLHHELQKNILQIYNHNIQSNYFFIYLYYIFYLLIEFFKDIVENSLRQCEIESKDIMNKLDINLLKNEQKGQSNGWDMISFSINVIYQLLYLNKLIFTKINEPLNIIFDQNTLKQYRLISNFLFKLRRQADILNSNFNINLKEIWNRDVYFRKQMQQYSSKQIDKIFKKCSLLRNELNYFFKTTIDYVLTDVIEIEYQQLIDQFHKLQSMDHIIETHQKFIKEVSDKIFLTQEKIQKIFQQIYGVVHRFNVIEEIIFTQMEDILTEVKSMKLNQKIYKTIQLKQKRYIQNNSQLDEIHSSLDQLYNQYQDILYSFRIQCQDNKNFVSVFQFNSFYIEINQK